MKNSTRIISLLVVFLMLFSFASCGDDKKEDTTTTKSSAGAKKDSQKATSGSDDTTADGSTTAQSGSTTAKAGATTAKSGATTAKSGSTTKAVTTTKAATATTSIKQYTTTSEILEFYRTSAKRVKSAPATKVVRDYEIITKLAEPTGLTGSLIADGFKEGKKDDDVVYTGDNIKSKSFVENTDYVISNSFTASMIKSATCTYSSGKYYIVINVKDDASQTQTYAKMCVNCVTPAVMAESSHLPESTFKVTASDTRIKATIDAATGNLLTFNGYTAHYLEGMGATFKFGMEQQFIITM